MWWDPTCMKRNHDKKWAFCLGRAGDAVAWHLLSYPLVEAGWYVSNVSIIFDCSILYYLLFWTLLGFIIHFYIIFGTNLLTRGPTHNCYFLSVLGFQRKGISNGFQMEWNLRERDFLNEQDPRDLDPTSRNKRGGHEVGGAPTPPSPRRALHPRDLLFDSLE